MDDPYRDAIKAVFRKAIEEWESGQGSTPGGFVVSKEALQQLVKDHGVESVAEAFWEVLEEKEVPPSYPLERVPPNYVANVIEKTKKWVASTPDLPVEERQSHYGKTKGPSIPQMFHLHLLSTFLSGSARNDLSFGLKRTPNRIRADKESVMKHVACNVNSGGALLGSGFRAWCKNTAIKTASAFPIYAAMWIYQKERQRWPCETPFCVIDPCAGWGDRLAAAKMLGVSYDGFDVSSTSIALCQKIDNYIACDEKNATHSYRLYQGAEESEWPVHCKGHLVFTSPPYGACEKYDFNDDHTSQAWHKFGEKKKWVTDFYLPLLRNAKKSLLPGGRVILNIDDTTSASYCQEMIDRAKEEVGLSLVGTYNLNFPYRNTLPPQQKAKAEGGRLPRCEPIFIFEQIDDLASRVGSLRL